MTDIGIGVNMAKIIGRTVKNGFLCKISEDSFFEFIAVFAVADSYSAIAELNALSNNEHK